MRAQYDISEQTMRRTYEAAHRSGAMTGERMVQLLEKRLDATVLRSGFARTIDQARQTVTHRHVLVNGARVDRPGYVLRPGDIVSIAPRSTQKDPFLVAAAGAHSTGPRAYLEVAIADLTATLLREPARGEVPVICDEDLVVEFSAR